MASTARTNMEDARMSKEKRRITVCTRIHQNNAQRPVDMAKVGEFVRGALQYGDSVALAVGMSTPPDNDNTSSDPVSSPEYSLVHSVTQAAQAAEEEWAFSQSECGYPNGDTTANKTHGDIEIEEGGGRTSGPSSREAKALGGSARRVTIIPVTPWGNFTPALNALLSFAARDGAELVLFQSLETAVSKDAVLEMETLMGPKYLVVGGALTGHAFQEGETVQLTGVTTPWNTLALWDVPKLSKLGFIGVAEGLVNGVAAGVEEVSVIATLQALLGPENCKARLVRLPQVKWQAEWEDEGRRRWHESKMASKVDRAEAQMRALGITRGLVEHVAVSR